MYRFETEGSDALCCRQTRAGLAAQLTALADLTDNCLLSLPVGSPNAIKSVSESQRKTCEVSTAQHDPSALRRTGPTVDWDSGRDCADSRREKRSELPDKMLVLLTNVKHLIGLRMCYLQKTKSL